MSWDMGPLLAAVRTRLRSQVTALGNRVYVAADESMLPSEAAFPCATVKDGGTDLAILNNQTLALHHVVVSCFVQNLRDVESPIVGDAAGTPGLQSLVDDQIDALKDYVPTITGVAGLLDSVRPTAISGTEVFVDVDGVQEIVKKSVTWLYRQKPSI
jgi:hypothetical protein